MALVLGGWSVLWAVRRAPGQPWSALVPVLGAFAAAMFAFALLSAHAEAVLALLRWIRADDPERDLLRGTLSSVAWRPLVAAALAIAVMVASTGWARGRPGGVAPARPLSWLEGAVLVAIVLCAAAGVTTLALLDAVLNQSTAGPAAALAHLTRIQNLARFGTLFAVAELAFAGLLALGRARRG